MLVDTHAHLHFEGYNARLEEVLAAAKSAGVIKIITVGVNEQDSADAIKLAGALESHGVFASVGLHPHDASRGQTALEKIADLAPEAVAIGECGLDYFRNLSTKEEQEYALRFQIDLALHLDKPMIFHVRDAFDDFFQILDSYSNSMIRGVVHCFTSSSQNMNKAVERGLLVAFNGIMTFTKDASQLEAAKNCPLESMVLETDCPFLTPAPKRGQINEPANLKITAKFLAELRGEDFEALASQTSGNAIELFGL